MNSSSFNENEARSGINNEFLQLLNSLTPEQFILLSAIIGILIASNLNTNEQNLIGLFLSNVGITITSISSRRELIEELALEEGTGTLAQIQNLKAQIQRLEQRFNS